MGVQALCTGVAMTITRVAELMECSGLREQVNPKQKTINMTDSPRNVLLKDQLPGSSLLMPHILTGYAQQKIVREYRGSNPVLRTTR
jgi:hypothetical protein